MDSAHTPRLKADETTALRTLGLCLAFTVSLLAIVTNAWIGDDALIGLRAIANALNGNGATFNVLERVQVFSSPSWFMMLLAANLVYFDPILWAIGLGILCAVLYLGLVMVAAGRRSWILAVALLVVLATSPAFAEWSTSGLENALAFLLFGLLLVVAAPRLLEGGGWHYHLVFGLLVAAIALTRLDLLLVVTPIAGGILWQSCRVRPARAVGHRTRQWAGFAIGVLAPLVAWFTASVLYYGYALPNTAYAKLNISVPLFERILRGLNYFRISGVRQPLTIAVIVIGMALVVFETRRPQRRVDRLGIALGLMLYFAYVVWIGGDFMEGRFLSVPLAIAALSIATSPALEGERPSRSLAAALLALAAASAVLPLTTPWLEAGGGGPEWGYDDPGYGGVSDERGYYVSRGMGLWSFADDPAVAGPTHIRILRESLASWSNVDTNEVTVAPAEGEGCQGQLGSRGVLAGPAIHIIDPCALADPTLARVTFEARGFAWRAGHYPRAIPEGYAEAIRTGDAGHITDETVRAIFASLHPRVRVGP